MLDKDLGVPIDITWFRSIYVMTDGKSLFHTDVGNDYSINTLAYSSSELASDPIVAVAKADENQIIAFNRYSTEYFLFDPAVDTGTSVLVPVQGKSIRAGIVGTHCKTNLGSVFFIIGGRKEDSPSVHMIQGGQIVSIATRAIDQLISKYTESQLATIVMESRVVDRDELIIIHLPNETLIYNHTVGKAISKLVAWTYVKTGIEVDEPWRGKFGVFDTRVSKWIYGDIKENKLAYLDDQSAAQYGQQSEMVFYTPIISALETFSINQFELKVISGFAPIDLTIMNSYSSDGVTFQQERTSVLSTPHSYSKRYVVRDRYYIRDEFSMKFRITSKYKVAFSSLELEYS